MTIIALCGFAGSGKDTVADYLVKHHNFHKLSFASVIKDIASIIFMWDRNKLEGLTESDRLWREQVDEWWSKQLNMPQLTPRYVLRYFGTDLFRNHWHPEIWVKIIERKLSLYDNIVITDCRFVNEINMLLQNNAKIIRVERNMPSWYYQYMNTNITPPEIGLLHESETNWIRCKYDYALNNDSTLDCLYNNIRFIINELHK